MAAPIWDHQALVDLVAMRMPFGRYSGRRLIDLPEHYVVWMARQGFPAGKLGEMLQSVYEIKVNGLEYLFEPLRTTAAIQSRNVVIPPQILP